MPEQYPHRYACESLINGCVSESSREPFAGRQVGKALDDSEKEEMTEALQQARKWMKSKAAKQAEKEDYEDR